MGGAEGGQGGEGSGREWRTRGGEAASQSEFERTTPTRRSSVPRDALAGAPAPRRRLGGLLVVVRGATALEAGDLRQARVLQGLVDPVAHPLRIPPLEGRHRDAVHEYLVVQVVADGEAGRTRVAELLLLVDGVAHLDVERREVAVERLEPESVVEHDGVAVD